MGNSNVLRPQVPERVTSAFRISRPDFLGDLSKPSTTHDHPASWSSLKKAKQGPHQAGRIQSSDRLAFRVQALTCLDRQGGSHTRLDRDLTSVIYL